MQAIIEAARARLEAEEREAGRAWRDLRASYQAQGFEPTCGLMPDAVRQQPEYRAAKARHRAAFEALRAFNTKYPPQRRASR